MFERKPKPYSLSLIVLAALVLLGIALIIALRSRA